MTRPAPIRLRQGPDGVWVYASSEVVKSVQGFDVKKVEKTRGRDLTIWLISWAMAMLIFLVTYIVLTILAVWGLLVTSNPGNQGQTTFEWLTGIGLTIHLISSLVVIALEGIGLYGLIRWFKSTDEKRGFYRFFMIAGIVVLALTVLTLIWDAGWVIISFNHIPSHPCFTQGHTQVCS